ncbi:ABC transporter substrate-binding protein [Nocardioides maradonensis]
MKRTTRRVRHAALLAGAVSLALVTSACGGGSGGSSAAGTVTIVSGPAGPFVPGLSPFSTTDGPGIMNVTSLVYEPLVMFNAIKPTDAPKPWLASAYKWSDGGKTLTFTIPSGRQWSDGTPLTAKDVAFTFDLIKKHPSLNINGLQFASASAPNDTTAVVKFAGPAYAQLYTLGKVLMVPEHIWSTIPDPTKFTNDKPVGSGPYLLSGITAQAINFAKNPHYWQAGLPKVNAVRVTSYTSQNAAISAIGAGQIDWNNVFLSNPEQQFTAKDPSHRSLWLEPAGDMFLCPNTQSGALGNSTVREALAYAIDRDKAVTQVEGQYYAPSDSVTGLREGQTEFIPSDLASAKLTYDPAKVKSLLAQAGYNAGNPLKLTLLLPSEYTDWMSLGTLLVNEMKAAGIDASLQGTSVNSWTSAYTNGNYQLTICGLFQSSGPYNNFNSLLDSSLTAPVGQAAVSNIVRWNDPKTDQLLQQYRSSNDPAVQKAAIGGLGRIISQQYPIIPLMSVSSFGSYTTAHVTGFPTKDDPYQTDSIATPFTEDVVLHLEPAQ